jgi:hypothetical protein
VARFWPKPKVAYRSRSLPEMMPNWSSGMFLVRSPPGSLVGDALVAIEGAGLASLASPASKKFGFPPSRVPELTFPAAPSLARPLDPVFKVFPLRPLQIPQLGFTPPSLAEAAVLAEKLRSPLPVVVSKHFQCYYRRVKVLREGQFVKWNEELFSDSLEAAKMTVGRSIKKVMAAEPLVKKAAKPPVKQSLRKGFLNLCPKVPVNPTSPQKVIEVEMVGPSSPSRGCLTPYSSEGNGLSLSRIWPVGFDQNGEIVAWEEDNEFWDGLPLDWALDGAFEEEALAIRDVMEEEFLREKMLACQKSKGKRELLNLQSSIDYGDGLVSSRRRKG